MSRLAERTAALKLLSYRPKCGWMCDEVAFLLYSMVKFTRPDVVVQIGHLWGKSALMVLEAMSDGFLTSDLIEEDTYRADPRFSSFVTERTPPLPPVRMISIDIDTADAGAEWLQDTYPGFRHVNASGADWLAGPDGAALAAECQGKRVLAIIDGDHSETMARADMEGVLGLNRPFIFLDDTTWIPHLGALARDFAARHAYQVMNLPLYNGVCLLAPEVIA